MMANAMEARVPTGIQEFDKMLFGGFMRGDSVLLAGSAGTGKSTIGIQYLLQGAAEGEAGIYLTFEELPDQLYRDASNFGWDLRKLESENKLRVICTSPDVLIEPSGLEAILDSPIKEMNARRIVVDSLSHFNMFMRPDSLRMQVYRNVMYFKTKGMSSVLIWEATQNTGGSSFTVSEEGISFLTDCIVLLKLIEINSSLRRGLVIMKMRGSQHDHRLREYEITPKGVKVLGSFENYEGLMGGTPTRAASEKFAELFTKAAKKK
jgi:circadian clock protein KaiC